MRTGRREWLGLAVLLGVWLPTMALAADASKWVEGRHYAIVVPAQTTQVPAGKVEVTEVFSYGCPACNQFDPSMQKIRAALPPNAQFVRVHASWNANESWPLFQRAYLTAQALGIADKTHTAMFAAIWGEGGELAVVDSRTQRIRTPPPTLQDVARFYAQHGGVTEAQFLQTAKSFSVEMGIRQSDALVKGYQTPSTPTLVVAGKYRLDMSQLRGTDEIIELIRYLVQKAASGH